MWPSLKLIILFALAMGYRGVALADESRVDIAIVPSIEGLEKSNSSTAVPIASIPIDLDGDLSDAAWQAVEWQVIPGENADTQTRTEYAMAQGDGGLYLAIRCHEPDMQSLRMKSRTPDALFEFFHNDDWVEVLIDPALSGQDYYWLIANPLGTQTDLCAVADPDRSWNGQWRVSTQQSDSTWTLEFHIPYMMFNRTKVGDTWAIQIVRRRINDGKMYPSGASGTARMTSGGTYRRPDTWPRINGLSSSQVSAQLDVTPLRLEPIANKSGDAMLIAQITNLSDSAVELGSIFQTMRPGAARGLVPHGTGPRDRTALAPVKVEPNESISVTTVVSVGPDETLIASLSLFDAEGRLLHCTPDRGVRIDHVLDGPGLQYSHYTTEESARVQLQLEEWGPGHELFQTLVLATGVTRQTQHEASSHSIELSLDLESVPVGRHKLLFELQAPDGRRWRRAFDLIKVPPAPATDVRIDQWRRAITVDGEPYVAVGNSPLITHGLSYAQAMMHDMADNGFNTIHLWGGFLTKDSDIPVIDEQHILACFDAAGEAGLKVIVSIGALTQNEPDSPFLKYDVSDDQRLETISELVQLLRDRPELLGYEIGDEPEFFVTPEWLERVYATIKSQDPWHLVTINNCRGARSTLTYRDASDTAGIDYYPAGKWPCGSIGPLTSEVVDFAGTRPVKTWVQGYKIFNPRAPSPAELVMMTYSSVARGSSAVFYFIGKPEAGLWNAQGKCAQELVQITGAVTATRTQALNVQPSDCGVYASLRREGDDTWIIAVNESDTEARCKIVLPDDLTYLSAEVLFEARTLEPDDGVIRDAFAGYARHVYKLKMTE